MSDARVPDLRAITSPCCRELVADLQEQVVAKSAVADVALAEVVVLRAALSRLRMVLGGEDATERVARAIWDHEHPGEDGELAVNTWDRLTGWPRDQHLELSAAVLAKIREAGL